MPTDKALLQGANFLVNEYADLSRQKDIVEK
jgi:hypothetical protein